MRRLGRTPTALAAGMAAITSVVAATSPATAQDVPWRAGGGLGYELYSFSSSDEVGIESISLLTLPFGAGATLGDRLTVEVAGAFASGSVSLPGGSDLTLSGLVDTDVSLRYRLVGDAVTLFGVATLPTGSETHDDEEIRVAGAVAADLLPFRITNWGTGGGGAVGITATRRFGSFGGGMTVSYRATTDFEPIEGRRFTYEPGDEVHIRAAIDRSFGRGMKWTLSAGFRSFQDDELDGSSLFSSGNRVEVLSSLAYPVGAGAAGIAYAGILHRETGTSLQSGFPGNPSQDLIVLGAGVRTALGAGWLTPRVDARIFRSDDGAGEGFVVGAGGTLELPVGSASLGPTARGRIGRIDGRGERSSWFTGVELGLSIRWGQ